MNNVAETAGNVTLESEDIVEEYLEECRQTCAAFRSVLLFEMHTHQSTLTQRRLTAGTIRPQEALSRW